METIKMCRNCRKEPIEDRASVFYCENCEELIYEADLKNHQEVYKEFSESEFHDDYAREAKSEKEYDRLESEK